MVKGWGVPVLLFVMVLILRPHIAGDAYPFAQGLLLIPVLVGCAIFLLSPVGSAKVPKHILPVLLLPWALSGWTFVTLFWAPDPGQGLRESIALFGSLTVFSMAFWLMRREKEFQRRSMLVTGLILLPVLASAAHQRIFGLARLRETLRDMEGSGELVTNLSMIIAENRVFAGFLNPNIFAGFLAIGICLTLDLLLTAHDRKRFLFFAFLTGSQCFALIMTGSVGGSIVAVAMAGGVLLARREFKIREVAIAGAVVFLVAAGIFIIRGVGFLSGPDSSLIQRGGYMAAGIRMALVHPVLGWGSGSSPGALMGFVAEGFRPVADPHNFLVRAWISWGSAGLALLLAFLFLWGKTVFKGFTVSGWRQAPMGYAGFAFGALAFLGHSLLDMDFFVPETAMFGWCALGAALGLAVSGEGGGKSGPEEPRSGLVLFMGGAALVLVLLVFVFLQGESLAFRAGKAVGEGEFETAADLYRDARGMLPMNGRFALEEGRARAAAGDTAAARELFRKADSLMRASPYPTWELGRAAQAAGEWGESIPLLETALLRYGTSPRIRIDLAMAYLKTGEGGQVYELLKEARRLSMFDSKTRDLADEVLSKMDQSTGPRN